MSLPESTSDRPRGVLVRRPRATIYTMLLLASLLAITISSLLMVLELLRYEGQMKPPANLRTSSATFHPAAPIV